MGMLDYFQPVPPIKVGNTELSGWQGKGGPCALYVWRQGSPAPVEHAVDEEWKEKPEVMVSCRLPDGESEIYTTHPDDRRWIVAKIIVRGGIWAETKLEEEETDA